MDDERLPRFGIGQRLAAHDDHERGPIAQEKAAAACPAGQPVPSHGHRPAGHPRQVGQGLGAFRRGSQRLQRGYADRPAQQVRFPIQSLAGRLGRDRIHGEIEACLLDAAGATNALQLR